MKTGLAAPRVAVPMAVAAPPGTAAAAITSAITTPATAPAAPAAVVALADAFAAGPPSPSAVDGADGADGAGDGAPQRQLERARAFAEPLLAGRTLDTGEDAWAHADGVAAILHAIGAAPAMRAAAYLVYAGDYLSKPEEVVAKAFGASHASLVASTRRLVQIQRAARQAQQVHQAQQKGALQHAQAQAQQQAQQIERVRKMLLAFSHDLRVVLLRLASRLQTLRWFAASKQPCPEALAREALQVFAPLANRLGIWQVKWEMEDLAFRFLQPEAYQTVARLLDEKRVEREHGVQAFAERLAGLLATGGLRGAEVQGRPKHLYSIWKKMHGKQLGIDRVLDLRALRVVVAEVDDCYAVLGRVHEAFRPVPGEFDDYIARPKPNGYQSLHTVVLDDAGRPVEVQVRTRAMHERAEHGVAAHWAYKEAGVKGYAGVSADSGDARLTEARKAVLRQLLAWEQDYVSQAGGVADGDADLPGGRPPGGASPGVVADPRVYVFTPAATIVELPQGATPIDFAYVVHTSLGHRCRGARVDGAIVPLNTPLASGQTVEIIATKEGGPSLDWLNAELGYLQSPRSKAKVRAWFNALQHGQTVARGRDAVERLLQRLGRTAMRLDELAARLGFRNADALFEVVGKEEFSLRNIENLLRPAEPAPSADDAIALRRPRVEGEGESPKGGVLVVGVESLMTTLARCCRPAPPDAISGYITRGKGVAVHRRECSNLRDMARRSPERVIPVAWGVPRGERAAVYPVDVAVEAADRQGLLRDITDVLAKEGMNVSGMKTQTTPDSGGGTAWMGFTVEVSDAGRLAQVLARVERIDGVRRARRR